MSLRVVPRDQSDGEQVWHKPVAEACPECGSTIVLEKVTKKSGPVRYCPNEACKYEREFAVESA
ncbi:MAG TPA: hypothetical protein VG206_08110 [Terriglobia bacterium]|nr:hypothetical protein [Terriglobia bacterium]